LATEAKLLDVIYNAGERLVPGETHDREELIRHKSSYRFFRRVIEADILQDPGMLAQNITILDIGCGTGHGAFMLTDILGAQLVGIDPSPETIEYAKVNYAASNALFLAVDAEDFFRTQHVFDYVVSRHALEHIKDGLDLALRVGYRKRLMVNVPFNEAEGNIHHKVNWIQEDNFQSYPNREFFYEGSNGVTCSERRKDRPPNSIICVSSADGLCTVKSNLKFPLPAWQAEFLQELGIRALESDLWKREALLVSKQASLVKSEASVRAQEALLAEREGELVTREAELASREAELTSREAELTSREAALRVVEFRKADTLARELQTERLYTEKLKQQLHIMDGARLWRVTQFVRGLVGRPGHVLDLERPPRNASAGPPPTPLRTGSEQTNVESLARELQSEQVYAEKLKQQLRIMDGSRLWRAAQRLRRLVGRPRHVLDLERPPALAATDNATAGLRSMGQIFRQIYVKNAWGADDSRSGTGSDLTQTAVVRETLPGLLRELRVRSMLDVPCGDFHWMRMVDIDVDYTGADVVADLIEANNARYANDRRRFRVVDISSDELPRVDLVFCRDLLVHFSFSDALRAISNLKRSGSTYLLTTTFTNRTANADIETGQWRPLNLQLPPFDFPPPLRLINENCTEWGSDWADKSLGLWRLDDLSRERNDPGIHESATSGP